MDISDIIPKDGKLQRIYCEKCGSHCDLGYTNFDEIVSGIKIRIQGLPVLICPSCGTENLPDLSRFAVTSVHKQAIEKSSKSVRVDRQKRVDEFTFTDVPFDYDADDYYYIPGLTRPWDTGFLQPLFFNRAALLKYDNSPHYQVQFASTTYGTIYTGEMSISFGINRFGNLVMWLGDVAKLPKNEQYYLRSENVPSDHSIGSEFYDGQIEVKFTDPSVENILFKLRSEFIEKCFLRFGHKIAHLEPAAFDLALSFNRPVVDTPKERRHVADTFNKIYLESFDNKALLKIAESLDSKPKGTGSLKRLQAVLEAIALPDSVDEIMMPLYVLYDLRVHYSHLTSNTLLPLTVASRLGLPQNTSLSELYERLLFEMTVSFQQMIDIVGNNAKIP